MDHSAWLTGSLIYLAAAVIAVPLARFLKLGSIIGYLGAGILIGPWGLKLVTRPEDMLQFAEFGVVLMLFLVGLELEPQRLWSLRKPIFGWGSVQLFGSALLLALGALACGIDWRLAVVAALGLAMSSTAIGLGVLAERNVMGTTSGEAILSVSLLQDIAAIPILALVPFLAIAGADSGGNNWLRLAMAIGTIAVIILGGRLLLRPALRWIANSETPEIFTAASLLLVVATAALMNAVGLSMALGAFLAGVLLAESEYRRELETDIEPFKGLLLGLFFIAVGMTIDFGLLRSAPLTVALLVAGFLAIKLVTLWAVARIIGVTSRQRFLFAILLSQGGEFAFVVFGAAKIAGILSDQWASLLTMAVALSMTTTPLLLILHDKWICPKTDGSEREPDAIEAEGPVIIAGFGRFGQIVGRLLLASGQRATVLDHDPDQIELLRRFGYKVFYGDATRLDLLRAAGAGEARLLVNAIDDIEDSLQLTDIVRENFPKLQIVARARNVSHLVELRTRGVEIVERETFEAALRTARHVLEALGHDPFRAREIADTFRRHNVRTVDALVPIFRDENKRLSAAKAGREELEEMFTQDRLRFDEEHGGKEWQ